MALIIAPTFLCPASLLFFSFLSFQENYLSCFASQRLLWPLFIIPDSDNSVITNKWAGKNTPHSYIASTHKDTLIYNDVSHKYTHTNKRGPIFLRLHETNVYSMPSPRPLGPLPSHYSVLSSSLSSSHYKWINSSSRLKRQQHQ